MPKAKKLPPGKRHPLRVYQRRFEMLQPITFLIPILSYFLWWIAPDYGVLASGRDYLILVVIIAVIIFIGSLIAPAFCYVQCFADYLLIATPFYRMNISYLRLGQVSAVNFGTQYPLSKQKELEQLLLTPLFKEQRTGELTVVGVPVKKFPLPIRWLKFWFSRYMFMPRDPGLLFMTPDWMGLSRELEVYRHDYLERRRRKEVKLSPASQILAKEDMEDG